MLNALLMGEHPKIIIGIVGCLQRKDVTRIRTEHFKNSPVSAVADLKALVRR